MKKILFLLVSSLLLVGCSSNGSSNTELTNAKNELNQLKIENEQLQSSNAELQQKLEEYELYSNSNNPGDDYSFALNASLNNTLNFIEALNKKNLETLEGLLSSKAKLDVENEKIIFTLPDGEFEMELSAYNYPLEDFSFRGAGYSNDNEKFLLFFSFVGGDGDDIYNIETEAHFVNENGEWKMDLLQS